MISGARKRNTSQLYKNNEYLTSIRKAHAVVSLRSVSDLNLDSQLCISIATEHTVKLLTVVTVRGAEQSSVRRHGDVCDGAPQAGQEVLLGLLVVPPLDQHRLLPSTQQVGACSNKPQVHTEANTGQRWRSK